MVSKSFFIRNWMFRSINISEPQFHILISLMISADYPTLPPFVKDRSPFFSWNRNRQFWSVPAQESIKPCKIN